MGKDLPHMKLESRLFRKAFIAQVAFVQVLPHRPISILSVRHRSVLLLHWSWMHGVGLNFDQTVGWNHRRDSWIAVKGVVSWLVANVSENILNMEIRLSFFVTFGIFMNRMTHRGDRFLIFHFEGPVWIGILASVRLSVTGRRVDPVLSHRRILHRWNFIHHRIESKINLGRYFRLYKNEENERNVSVRINFSPKKHVLMRSIEKRGSTGP